MAAYESVARVLNTIDDIQNHPLQSIYFDKKQLESLHTILDYLLDFMERYNPHGGIEEEAALESVIASEAQSAEDTIEGHMVNHLLLGFEGDDGQTSSSSLQRVITDMNAVKEKVVEFEERKELKDVQPTNSFKSFSRGSAKNDMVGFEDELIQLKDRLTGLQSNLQIIPIVGMGGIGKTTLATNVYQSLLVSESFAVCAWVTISQNYSLKKILCELGSCILSKEISKSLGEVACESDLDIEDGDLGVMLYQSLLGRRYLIVLDDMWSIEVWDKIKFIFPDNGNRSRVVITSRISNMAAHLTSSSLEMKLLDEDNCWKLFCRELFRGDGCPPELEEIGKAVVRECRKLPLLIVVVGGVLRSSPRTREHWESFAREINSYLMSGDGNCLDILSLSYYHLPAHLKPCFLYMGNYKEDEAIFFPCLVKCYVAEGFLRPNDGQSLEKIAEDNLKELVDKNLILVGDRRWSERIYYLKMHDVVREVCLWLAEKEKFFYAKKLVQIKAGMGQIAISNLVPRVFDSLPGPTASLARKFRSMGGPLPFKSRFLRAFGKGNFVNWKLDVQQVHLRHLVYNPYSLNPVLEIPSELPSILCLLWNLQTLVIKGSTRFHAPSSIWHMTHLRHLNINDLLLPDPPQDGDHHALPNLQTLSRVVNFSFTEDLCKRLPNIKKLRVAYLEERQKCCYQLNQLHNLQSLKCWFHGNLEKGDLLESLVLPTSLRKLFIENSPLHWADLNTFGLSLPHLEVLRLDHGAVVGPEWYAEDGAFPRLKFLQISCRDLVKWSFDFFPVLEKIDLFQLTKLEEIPSSVGEIHTLRHLDVRCCSMSAAISSTHILEQQLDFGNEDLLVLVILESKEEELSLREKVESKSFSYKNFMIRNRCEFEAFMDRVNKVIFSHDPNTN